MRAMLFEKIDRILLTVENAEETAAYLENLFGIEFEPPIRDPQNHLVVVHSGRFGLEIGSAMKEGSSPLADGDREFVSRTGGGIRMIVVKVSNLDAAVDHFRQMGLEPCCINTLGDGKEAIYDLEVLNGVQLCLNEYKEYHSMGLCAREALFGEINYSTKD